MSLAGRSDCIWNFNVASRSWRVLSSVGRSRLGLAACFLFAGSVALENCRDAILAVPLANGLDGILTWDLGNGLEGIFFLIVENFLEGIFAMSISHSTW